MIPVTGNARMFLFRGPADMRKGFDGLSGMALTKMEPPALT